MITPRWLRTALPLVTLPFCATALRAQSDHLDERAVALTYHKVSGDTLDFRAAAQTSDAVRSATNFDREDVANAEIARMQSDMAAADPQREFVMRVDDAISEYDHARGEFDIGVFAPGTSVPLRVFGQDYKVVFSNADALRAIPMPKEQARVFDASLNGFGRRVVDEIHFRVTGAGDPAGAVTGPRVIRAEVVAARILDRNGRVVATPDPRTARVAAASTPAHPFDIATADVSGLRVGVSVDDATSTFERLFGKTEKGPTDKNAFPGLTTMLTVNDNGCWSMPGGRSHPAPGAVCVTAFADAHDVVRVIRIQRVFPWMDEEVFRRALVQKYGAVGDAQEGSSYTLGWGPDVEPALLYDRSGPHNALTAQYVRNDDYMTRGMNALPQIRVILSLVDANWAKAQGKP